MKAKSNVVIYGKISLSSDSEDLKDLVGVLKTILSEVGYPEKRSVEDEKKEDEELKKQLKKLEDLNGDEAALHTEGAGRGENPGPV